MTPLVWAGKYHLAHIISLILLLIYYLLSLILYYLADLPSSNCELIQQLRRCKYLASLSSNFTQEKRVAYPNRHPHYIYAKVSGCLVHDASLILVLSPSHSVSHRVKDSRDQFVHSIRTHIISSSPISPSVIVYVFII